MVEVTSTQYHSGSHVICDFSIETANDLVLTVVWTVGQFGEPVKCVGRTMRSHIYYLYL